VAGGKGKPGPLADSTLYIVEIRAKDYARLCRFYGEVLGLPTAMRDDSTSFAMFGKAAPFVAVVGKGFKLASGRSRAVPDFAVGDLDGALRRLKARRVRVLAAPVASHEGYRIARIADPEGNEIHLFEWSGAKPG
jgi:predicted enzyme related to lactoylglutathione lyase